MKHDSKRGVGSAADSARDSMVREMARIRAFETRLLDLFGEGKLFGTTHTCIGQEICTVALYPHLDRDRDAVFTNHRCHGHYLAWGGSMRALMAEIMGKSGGICGGRGGSQHLCDGRFYSQGVQGGSMPIAAGYVHRMRREGTGGIVVAHIGDGTLGQGVVYEAMNITALLQLPLLVVLEHNGVAQSTETSRTTAHDPVARFAAFGIDVDRRRADDPVALRSHLEQVVARVRDGRPAVQILDTFRLMAHSKGDDDRPRELLERAWSEDYLARLVDAGDPVAVEGRDAAEREVDGIVAELDAASPEPVGSLQVFAAPAAPLFAGSQELAFTAPETGPPLRVAELLNRGLDGCLADDPSTLLLGEDLLDPYGGAFKVTRGLSTKHSDRVFSTPISEAAITGFGSGFALGGGKAVVEIMFGDFATLATDQIVNQAAKMHFMYGGRARVPTTIRLVSGGYRGYGPTHSQSLEALFCGVPGLRVVALSRRHDPRALLRAAVLHDPNPVLFVENKLLYALRPHSGAPAGLRFVPRPTAADDDYPELAFTSCDDGETADVTVVAYGGMTDLVEEALEQLILDEELQFDYFVLTQLSPLRCEAIVESTRRTGRLVTVEEGPRSFGIGSEVVSQVCAARRDRAVRCARVGATEVPIPNSRLQELDVLPSRQRIVDGILSVYQEEA
jgi:2-oxoisovalerate dehydrogenase E1 component